jgi:hypothetical protein
MMGAGLTGGLFIVSLPGSHTSVSKLRRVSGFNREWYIWRSAIRICAVAVAGSRAHVIATRRLSLIGGGRDRMEAKLDALLELSSPERGSQFVEAIDWSYEERHTDT